MYDHLTVRDWESIADAIYHMNSVEDLGAFQKTALSCLQMLIPCYQITFWLEGIVEGRVTTHSVEYIGAEALYLEDVAAGVYDDDPYLYGLFLKTRTYVCRDSDVVSDRARQQSRLYNNVYKKQGIEYGLRAFLCHNGNLIGDLALFGTAEDGDFSKRDEEVLEVLAPHLTQGLARAISRNSVNVSDAFQSKLARNYDLTRREVEVAMLLIEGSSSSAIADLLCIAPATAKRHTHNIYRKMHVGNRRELQAKMEELSES